MTKPKDDEASAQQIKIGALLSQIPTKWVVAITILLSTGANQGVGGLVKPLLGTSSTDGSAQAAAVAAMDAKLDDIAEHQNETHRELDLTLAALPGTIAAAIADAIAPLQQRLEDNTVDIRVLQAREGIEPTGGSS